MYFHSPFLRQSAKSASAWRLCSASGCAAGRLSIADAAASCPTTSTASLNSASSREPPVNSSSCPPSTASGGSTSSRPLPRKTISMVLPPTGVAGISTPSSRRSVPSPTPSLTFFSVTARAGYSLAPAMAAWRATGSAVWARRAPAARKAESRHGRTRRGWARDIEKLLRAKSCGDSMTSGGGAPGYHEDHPHRRRQGEQGAEVEGGGRSPAVPEGAEKERGGERPHADRQVVPAEGHPAPVLGDEIGHQRPLHPLGQTEIDAVDGEERPGVPGLAGAAEEEVDRGIDQPAGGDERLAADAVREDAARGVGEGLDQVEQGPEDGDEAGGDLELAGPQEEEGVGRVAEGEQQENAEIGPEPAAEGGLETGRLPLSLRRRRSR